MVVPLGGCFSRLPPLCEPLRGRGFRSGVGEGEDLLGDGVPAVFAGDACLAVLSHAAATGGVAGKFEEGLREGGGVVRRYEQAVFAVVHDFGEVADAAGDDRQAGGVVFVDFQRREVEVVLRRVGGGGDVDLAEGGGNVGGGDAAADVGVGSEAAGGKVGFEVCPAGAVADDVQARGGVFGVDAGEGFDQERQAVPGFEGAEEADVDVVVVARGVFTRCGELMLPGTSTLARRWGKRSHSSAATLHK